MIVKDTKKIYSYLSFFFNRSVFRKLFYQSTSFFLLNVETNYFSLYFYVAAGLDDDPKQTYRHTICVCAGISGGWLPRLPEEGGAAGPGPAPL